MLNTLAFDLPQNIYLYSLFASKDTVTEKHEADIAMLQRQMAEVNLWVFQSTLLLNNCAFFFLF